MWLIVSELHQVHSICNFWVQNEMECQGAWELNKPYCERMSNIWSVLTTNVGIFSIINMNSIYHAKEETIDNAIDNKTRVEHLSLLRLMDQVFFSVALQIA
jgi:hypothetical protein